MLTRQMLENRRLAKERRERKLQIALDYGASLENHPPGIICDSSLLPFPKQELLDALLYSVANAPNAGIADLFGAAAITLSHYQDGVGSDPINMPGADNISAIEAMSPTELQEYLRGFDFDRIRSFMHMMSEEGQAILGMIGQAKEANLHIQPAYKKLWQRFRQQGLHSPFYPGYVEFRFDPSRSST